MPNLAEVHSNMEIGFDLAVISYQRITISNLMPTDRTNSVMKQKITAVKKNLTKE